MNLPDAIRGAAWEIRAHHYDGPDALAVEQRMADIISRHVLPVVQAIEKERLEQARLNGIGSEREARLMARLAATESALNDPGRPAAEEWQEAIKSLADAVNDRDHWEARATASDALLRELSPLIEYVGAHYPFTLNVNDRSENTSRIMAQKLAAHLATATTKEGK